LFVLHITFCELNVSKTFYYTICVYHIMLDLKLFFKNIFLNFVEKIMDIVKFLAYN